MTWIVVRRERERVVGVQPAMVCMASAVPGALLDLEVRCAVRCGGRGGHGAS